MVVLTGGRASDEHRSVRVDVEPARLLFGNPPSNQATATIPMSVQDSFQARLGADNPQRMSQAGALWQLHRLQHFYNNDELGVDLAVRQVTREQLSPGQNLPDHIWANLRILINTETRVKDAIDTVTSALQERIEDAGA